jgi:hypothetical protein
MFHAWEENDLVLFVRLKRLRRSGLFGPLGRFLRKGRLPGGDRVTAFLGLPGGKLGQNLFQEVFFVRCEVVHILIFGHRNTPVVKVDYRR